MLGGLQAARELQAQVEVRSQQMCSYGLPKVLDREQAARELHCRCEPEADAQL